MFSLLKDDVRAVFERDPAARSLLEVLLTYPGLHALIAHRIAHCLHSKLGLKLIARIISHISRWCTGIEIHPGAEIGRGFFIDHGMGVVIGETTIIADDVTLYQGVTLGGTGKERGKRHPSLESGVVVGAGAKILGDIKIGKNTRVGSGSVVIQSVPANSTVVGVPGHIARRKGERVERVSLNHTDLSDPVIDAVHTLQERLDRIEHQIDQRCKNSTEE